MGVPVKENLKAGGRSSAEASMRVLQTFESESLDQQSQGHEGG